MKTKNKRIAVTISFPSPIYEATGTYFNSNLVPQDYNRYLNYKRTVCLHSLSENLL